MLFERLITVSGIGPKLAVTALVNLGCAAAAAETAVRRAKAAAGEAAFEPLFRRALELVR